ncbi:MAG: hypothetical protein MI723_08035 [Caulobacterales bacterium]|nr:hypothetical protein [Caulobacterales bacterium]
MGCIAIIYGTTEGQTRKIARELADHFIRRRDEVRLVDATHPPAEDPLAGADAVIVAASLHVERYQSSVVHFAAEHARQLNALPSAFVSVSLSALGDEEDAANVDLCVDRFSEQTGWTPGTVHQAAGALRYTQYDFFKRWIMKRIAKEHGLPTQSGGDFEFTDWAALQRFAEDFAHGVGSTV